MRYIVALLIGLSLSIAALAGPRKIDINKIDLYAKPSDSAKIIARLDPRTTMIPIFTKNATWSKIAVGGTGQVGWVHAQQYKEALDQVYKPWKAKVVIHLTDRGKHPGPAEVTMYKNGRKLTSKQTKGAYRRFIEREAHMRQRVSYLFSATKREVRKVGGWFGHLFKTDNNIPSAPSMPPPVVIVMSPND